MASEDDWLSDWSVDDGVHLLFLDEPGLGVDVEVVPGPVGPGPTLAPSPTGPSTLTPWGGGAAVEEAHLAVVPPTVVLGHSSQIEAEKESIECKKDLPVFPVLSQYSGFTFYFFALTEKQSEYLT